MTVQKLGKEVTYASQLSPFYILIMLTDIKVFWLYAIFPPNSFNIFWPMFAMQLYS